MQPSTTTRYIPDFFDKFKQRIIPWKHLFCPKMLCYAWTEKTYKILEMAGKCLSLFLAGGRLQQPPSGFSYLTAKRLEPSSWNFLTLSAHSLCTFWQKNISGNVSSGHQKRSRDPTSRVLLFKFEVVLKPNCFFSISFKLSKFCKCTWNLYISNYVYRRLEVRSLRWPIPKLTRHRLGCFCTHHSLGGRIRPPPPAISKTDGRRETDEAAFERSRRDASKPLSKI